MLSQVVNDFARASAGLVDTAFAAREVALASAGMPSTINKLLLPPGNAAILNALRSVICAGADHMLDVEEGSAFEDEGAVTVIICVIVDAEAEMLTVTGGRLRETVAVTTSVTVVCGGIKTGVEEDPSASGASEKANGPIITIEVLTAKSNWAKAGRIGAA